MYAITATTPQGKFQGMMNIGVRPTVEENGERTVEAHLFGLDNEIYGEAITVRLHHKLREELRFESMELMKDRIAQDKIDALRVLGEME